MKRVIVPVADWVLVKVLKKDKTESGIVLPEASEQKSGILVLDVGDQVKRCKKGELIIAVPRTGIELGSPEFEAQHLIKEEFIIAVIKEDLEQGE